MEALLRRCRDVECALCDRLVGPGALAFGCYVALFQSLSRTDVNYTEQLGAVEHLLELAPTDRDASERRAYLLTELGRIQEAEQAFARLIELAPNEPLWHVDRGLTLERLARCEEALPCYDQALAIDPAFAKALRCRAQVLFRLHRYEEGLSACEAALGVLPDDSFVATVKADILAALKRKRQAYAAYRRALFLKASNAGTLRNGRVPLPQWEVWLDVRMTYYRIRCQRGVRRGWLLSRIGRLLRKRESEWIRVYDRILSEHPQDTKTLRQKARYLQDHWRLDDALQTSAELTNAYPDDVNAWTQQSLILDDLGRYGEALTASERALAFDAGSSQAWAAKAQALLGLGRGPEAAEAAQEALRLDPDNRRGKEFMGLWRVYEERKWRQGIRLLIASLFRGKPFNEIHQDETVL